MPRPKKYTLDETFFDKINTQEKAYILGFLYADGYNNTKTCITRIALQASDIEILEKIKNCLNTNKPIYKFSRQRDRDKGKNVQDVCRLDFVSKNLSFKLEDLGCMQKKSLLLKFPSKNKVPLKYQSHFIRGYFDGDGTIKIFEGRQSFVLVGTESFLKGIQNVFFNVLKLQKRKLYNPKDSDTSIQVLSYSALEDCLKIREWLYKDSSIFLDRKYNKFKTLKNSTKCLAL